MAFDDLINRRGSVKKNIGTILYYGALQNFLFNALQQALMMALWEEDEEWETKSDSVIKSMIDNIIYGFGLEGVIFVTVKNGIREYYQQEAQGWNAEHAMTRLELANMYQVNGRT